MYAGKAFGKHKLAPVISPKKTWEGAIASAVCATIYGGLLLPRVIPGTVLVAALAVAILVDQGRASYDEPVAKHWPEFAAAGKAEITIGQILSHQSGLNGWAAPTRNEDLYDWGVATARLAAQAPFWPPGTLASYHALTHGFLAGEVVRRITGQDIGAFIRGAIAVPLGADFHVGRAAAQDWRVAELLPPPPANAIPGGPGMAEIPRRAVSNPAPDPQLPKSTVQFLWRQLIHTS